MTGERRLGRGSGSAVGGTSVVSTPAWVVEVTFGRMRQLILGAVAGIALLVAAVLAFSDDGMKPPSDAGVASVRDHGKLEVRLVLR
jgi:hypothetical protein